MSEKKIIIEELKNTGLIVAPPSFENYHSKLFGAVGEDFVGVLSPVEPPVIFPDGKGWLQVWKNYDIQEVQFNPKFDTYSCVVYSIAKALCLYLFKVYGIKCTISEMYNAFYAGVKSGRGTTIEAGMESFRNFGWVEDKDYPFTADTTETQFRAKPPLTIQIRAKGKLTEWEVHWNVIPARLDAIAKAYRRTPVVLTGFAWASYYGEGVYYDYNNTANHAFLGLEIKDNGNNLISDTYPKDFQYVDDSQINAGDLIKELDKSFHYGSAHTVWITPKSKKKTYLTLLTKSMENFYYYWDGKHNFYYIGVPSGETQKYRQHIELNPDNTNENFLFIALKGSMNKSSWAEVSKYPDINSINKKFA